MKVLVPNKQSMAVEQVAGNDNDGFTYYNKFFQFPTHIQYKSGCTIAPLPYEAFTRDKSYTKGTIVYTTMEIGNITGKKLYKALTDISHDPNGDGCANCAPAPWECPICWEPIENQGLLDCFDNYINTQYIGICDDYLDFDASNADGVALLGCDAEQIDITWFNSSESKTLSYNIDQHVSDSFCDYFFRGWYTDNFLLSTKSFVDVNKVRVKIPSFKVGTILLGKIYNVGKTLYGYNKSNRDFSKIITTSTGLDYLQQGNKTKKFSVKLLIKNDLEKKIFVFLQQLSSTLALYLLEDGNWVFGYYKDFIVTKQNKIYSECELEIKGVI